MISLALVHTRSGNTSPLICFVKYLDQLFSVDSRNLLDFYLSIGLKYWLKGIMEKLIIAASEFIQIPENFWALILI